MLDTRTAQNQLEDLLRDTVLYALGRRAVTVASVAELRAYPTNRGMSGNTLTDDTLAVVVVSSVVIAAYRWSQKSTATDDGAATVQPSDVTANGRWLLWTSNVRFSPVVGGVAYYLHEIAQGPIERVIVIDKEMDGDEVSALLSGQVPSVFIEATGDNPSDMGLDTGFRWDTRYEFSVSTLAQNLRDRREVSQGSTLDTTVGANSIDGFLKALLSGTNLCAQESGIRNVQLGRAMNWFSEEAQRRVIRSRSFTIQATEINPAAPNDASAVQIVYAQAHTADLGELPSDGTVPKFDLNNCVTSGMGVGVGVGLTKTVAAGSATIDSNVVTYAGELKTFTASKDTYRDLLPNGTMIYVETVVSDDVEPAVTATAMRIGRTRTDTDGVLSDTMIAQSYINFENPVQTDLT